jgi:bifunctional N-acetylglucosamine-1-phosphate-uridyltransferase/glucosamine-1-phosphate-acetyltransferase GlmU-like protein
VHDAQGRTLKSLTGFIAAFAESPLGPWAAVTAWELTSQSAPIVTSLLESLDAADFLRFGDDVAVHREATVESGAILKGPLIVGPNCFIATGAYLRGGSWLDAHCTVGPGAELKSSFLFAGTKLAHFNFVGDSVIGSDVNLEAGSIICNYRNERPDNEILIRQNDVLVRTGCMKFGALIGDRCRIGANAVLAPGGILEPGTVVRRGAHLDQECLI